MSDIERGKTILEKLLEDDVIRIRPSDRERFMDEWREAIGLIEQAARAESPASGEVEPVAWVAPTVTGTFYGETVESVVSEAESFGATLAGTIPLYTHPPASQVPQGEERLADIYRRQLFECKDALNNLRSEYHNRMRELETEIEDLQEELQRVRRQADPETQDKEQSK